MAEVARAAWSDLCARLGALGDDVVAPPFPDDVADRVDAVAHLAEQVLCWTGWSVFHADPRRPSFQRHNDLITQWGGPNADNVYRHARVDPARRYRITGRMHSCEEFVLAVRCGFMHQERWGTVHEVTATELGIGAGDDFELIVGGEPPEGAAGASPGTSPGARWVPLPDGAVMVSFREYYYEWDAAEPATMVIECLDPDGDAPAPRMTAPELADRLADAAAGVEHSVRNWNTYLREHRAEGTDNVMAPPMKVAKGLASARYAFCFWDLGPDDALVLDVAVPAAPYWSVQCYELGTYELVDVTEHQSSLNHRQAVPDADGRVRFVLAHRDPGVANWLDVGGRRAGLCTLRWFWAEADPDASTLVVPLADLAGALAPGTARVGAAERAATMAARRRHLAWRFRT